MYVLHGSMFVGKILKCDQSNESYWAVLSCGTVSYAVQGGSNFWVWKKSLSVTIQRKAVQVYFPVMLFINYAIQGGSNFWVCW